MAEQFQPFDASKSQSSMSLGLLPQLQTLMDKLKQTSGFSDTEIAPVYETAIALSKPLPSGRTHCQERIAQLAILRSRLDTVIMHLKDKRSDYRIAYEATYDQQYTYISKLGRPNMQAIASEVNSKNPDMKKNSNKAESLTHFIEYATELRWTLNATVNDLRDRAGDVLRQS
ncbi:hypothetical protein HSE3_gp132 [Bacillus phage vB_BceM-HSE3]|nr:hypothetical protein HSE3_gp132 [Bacillus phage vB_BceM-HSE3]